MSILVKRFPIIFAVIVMLTSVSYYVYRSGQHNAFARELSQRIVQEKQRSSTLKFAAVTDFDWDKVYIFSPYTTKKTIEQSLGFRWSGSTSIEYDDGINLIVFVKDGAIVRYAEVQRWIDFIIPADSNGWTPEQAVFPMSSQGGTKERAGALSQ